MICDNKISDKLRYSIYVILVIIGPVTENCVTRLTGGEFGCVAAPSRGIFSYLKELISRPYIVLDVFRLHFLSDLSNAMAMRG